MSADENPSTSPILRPPSDTTWVAATKLGLIGAGIGLACVMPFVVNDHAAANSVKGPYVKARNILLDYQAAKGVWPKDFDLARPGEQFAGFKLAALNEALAACEIPGKWSFVAKSPEGWPVIIFTPDEPGLSYELTLGVVDKWVDDGDPSAGDMRVRPGSATLKLSAE
jgi:hypothetical protein